MTRLLDERNVVSTNVEFTVLINWRLKCTDNVYNGDRKWRLPFNHETENQYVNYYYNF